MSTDNLSHEAAVRRTIDATIARRGDAFTVSYLARTDRGYAVKFRQGIADLLRTVDENIFEDLARTDKLLDEVRNAFLRLRP
jgi:hypothetical protein